MDAYEKQVLKITRCYESVNLCMCVDVWQRLWLLLFFTCFTSVSGAMQFYKRTNMRLQANYDNVPQAACLQHCTSLCAIQFGAKAIWLYLAIIFTLFIYEYLQLSLRKKSINDKEWLSTW